MKILTNQRGFSLVELMIAMVLGLTVMAALFAFFHSNLRASNTALELSRLNQEMQTVMSMVSRDIRRAGYRADAVENRDIGDKTFMFIPGSFENGNWVGQDIGRLQSGGSEGVGPYGCIILKADLNAKDGLESEEIRGYRFEADPGVIQMQTGITGCAGSSWDRLTSRQIQITQFEFELDPAVVPAGQRLMQTVTVRLQGRLRSNADIGLALEQQVRLRNNVY